MTTNDKASPPPAAARGDVRELVGDRQAWFESEIAKAERQWIDGFHDRYEAGDDVPSMDHFVALWLAERTEALAAEGVQAGEVEQRARDALKREPGQQEGESASGYALRIATALSQQPEARGVVDAETALDLLDAACMNDKKVSWHGYTRDDRVEVMRRFLAALTGERNG